MPESVVAADSLRRFCQEIFVGLGMKPEDASESAKALVWANLRGIDAQGVLRVPWYAQMLQLGQINGAATIQTIREGAAFLFLEANRAPGHPVTVRAVRESVAKAKRSGICVCLIRNHTHQGALGFYTEIAAQAGMICAGTVSALPNMVPFGSNVAGLHNSPISIAVPSQERGSIILDMATSVVAKGRMYHAEASGNAIPLGWGLDKAGRPTTDPKAVDCLLPFGGAKGSGLALMMALLTSTLAGNPILDPLLSGAQKEREHKQNSFFAVIDIETFGELGLYKDRVDTLVDCLKSLPTEDLHSEITMPGEIQQRTYAKRSESGIPLPQATVDALKSLAADLGVADSLL